MDDVAKAVRRIRQLDAVVVRKMNEHRTHECEAGVVGECKWNSFQVGVRASLSRAIDVLNGKPLDRLLQPHHRDPQNPVEHAYVAGKNAGLRTALRVLNENGLIEVVGAPT